MLSKVLTNESIFASGQIMATYFDPEMQSDYVNSCSLALEHAKKQTNRYLEIMHWIDPESRPQVDANFAMIKPVYIDIESQKKVNSPTLKNHTYGNILPKRDENRLTDIVEYATSYSNIEPESMYDTLRSILHSECSIYLGEGHYTPEEFRTVFIEEGFLQNLFRLFDLNGHGFLEHNQWVEQMKGNLIENEQIILAEELESVAYVICGDNRITYREFCDVWNAPGILDQLYRVIDVKSCNQISTKQIMDFITQITNLRHLKGFDKSSLDHLESIFRKTVGNESEIRLEEFTKIVTSKNPFFTERVFQIFDKDNSGTISLQEFIDAIHQFTGQSTEDKIKFLFRVYDIDGDGFIQQMELQHVIRACMKENGMQFSEQQIENLTEALFEDADSDKRGAISYEALRDQLGKHDGLLENLSISIDRWLVPPIQKKKKKTLRKPHQFTIAYMKNNQILLTYLALYITINSILFTCRAFQYQKSNGFVIVARASGQCLNFNCSWILVMMLRQCITYLRTRGFCSILPLDHHIYLHKLTGAMIAIFSLIHTLMHLFNISTKLVNDAVINARNFTITEWLFTTKPNIFGLIPGLANPTGFVLLVILFIIFVCSQPFVRRKGSFEVFYWTHLLYIPFWILVIIHGPNFWKWFVVPGVIYSMERILRFIQMKSEHGRTYISSGILLPSQVTHLVIKRPLHFDFHPGDYVFVNIPAIATYEWHPFTLSSAPEQEDYMWLHIRGVGEWTNRLYAYFEKEQHRLHNDDLLESRDSVLCPTYTPKSHMQQTELLTANFTRAIQADKRDSVGITNTAFTSSESCSSSKDNIAPSLLKMNISKSPLEKSLSMPDMQKRKKKGERQLALIEYTRSESEYKFDEKNIREAHARNIVTAYLSPQNKCLAQSFRYMRNKPIIIPIKPPYFEGNHAQQKTQPLSVCTSNLRKRDQGMETSKRIITPDHAKQLEEASATKLQAADKLKHNAETNYPVGKPLEVCIDGPYGAPSSHIFGAQHAVLIATGIGVTPFASILQSIMHRYWKARHSCPRCYFEWASDIPKSVMNLRKVDFFWINRDQRSFEWFVNLLSQLEIEQAELGGALERFLDMHMFITSALQKTDMKAVGLQLALDLLHEKEKRDLITGLKTRTNAGRPNWDKVFKQITAQKKGKVTVFYCGPPELGKILRYKCDQHGFAFRKESF